MSSGNFEALRAAPLLRDFTDVGIRLLAEATSERLVGKSAYAFRAGEPSETLSFVARGTLQLLPRDGGAPLAELTAFDSFGGLALLTPGEHLVSAVASTDVTLLDLSRAAFDALQQTRPRLCLKLTLALARDLADRLQEARGPLREFLLWQVSKRQGDAR
jgi:CRP-like cAMP-binding protein